MDMIEPQSAQRAQRKRLKFNLPIFNPAQGRHPFGLLLILNPLCVLCALCDEKNVVKMMKSKK